jgi:hypothetical protein
MHQLWDVQLSFSPLDDLDDGPKASSITTVKTDICATRGVGLDQIQTSLTGATGYYPIIPCPLPIHVL